MLHKVYHFDVEKHLLNTKDSPQKQVFKHLSNFVAAYDNPQTLLVVYYAGHGYKSAKGTGHLALSGKPIMDTKAKIAASFEWHEVERTLAETLSDVLVIFDCCNAGLLCKSALASRANDTRTFQYLGACESEQQTRRAGKHSFTSAVIWALEGLAEEASFPITKLVQKIEAHKDFPHDKQRPVLFGGRFNPVSEIICLAPMQPPKPEERLNTTVNDTSEVANGDTSKPSRGLPRGITGADTVERASTIVNDIHEDINEDKNAGLPKPNHHLSRDVRESDSIEGVKALEDFVRNKTLKPDAIACLFILLVVWFVVGPFT